MNGLTEPYPKVLIIEDDSDTALSLRVLIHRSLAWGAIVAYDGSEARDKLDEKPDAVLLDLKLPDMDGEDLIGEIRDRCPGAPIVVITGQVRDSPRIARVASMGPDKILYKPFEKEDLIVGLTGKPTPDPTPPALS